MKTLIPLLFLLCLCGTANADTCEIQDAPVPEALMLTDSTPEQPHDTTNRHIQPAGLNGRRVQIERPRKRRG